MERQEACVNVTEDPELFLVTAFKHEPIQGFIKPCIEEDLTLASADASIFVEKLSSYDVSRDRCCFVCQARSVEVHHPFPRVFSRGRAEAIEAIIHATRIESYLREGRLEDVEEVERSFDDCKGVVERVSEPDSTEARIIQTLKIMINRWREEASR